LHVQTNSLAALFTVAPLCNNATDIQAAYINDNLRLVVHSVYLSCHELFQGLRRERYMILAANKELHGRTIAWCHLNSTVTEIIQPIRAHLVCVPIANLNPNSNPSDIPVTVIKTNTKMIDFSKTHTETNTEMIFSTDTI